MYPPGYELPHALDGISHYITTIEDRKSKTNLKLGSKFVNLLTIDWKRCWVGKNGIWGGNGSTLCTGFMTRYVLDSIPDIMFDAEYNHELNETQEKIDSTLYVCNGC